MSDRVRLGLITAVLFLLAGMASKLGTAHGSALQALWPANAVVFGFMICRRRTRAELVTIVTAGVLSSLATQILYRNAPIVILLYPIANGLQWVIAYTLLRRMWSDGELLDRASNVFALFVASAAALAITSPFAGIGLFLARGLPFWDGYAAAFSAGLLGAMLVAPGVVVVAHSFDPDRWHAVSLAALAEGAITFGLVAAVTYYVFFHSALPTTFTIVPFVLLATFRQRAVGAIGAMIIVAAISSYATATGHGPIVRLLSEPAEKVMMLRVFLAGTFVVALPVAAMLTERDHHAEEARLVADHFRLVVENIGDVIFRIDREGRWVYLNPAWEGLSGQPMAQSLGRIWTERFAEEDRAELNVRAGTVLSGEAPTMQRVLRLDTLNGPRWVELFVQGLRDHEGRISGATGTLRDIDDRKRFEENVISAKRRAEQRAREATLLASTDELTGIANRRAFMGQLDREIASAVEFGWPLAVAMFDVDHFKSVNDRYGHAVGDRVLQLIAAKAAAVVRGGDLVGRLGGEEFAILMPGATATDAAHVAERLQEAMAVPEEDGALPTVTVSIGIAAREHQRDAGALLASADAALYQAKGAGRNRVRIAA